MKLFSNFNLSKESIEFQNSSFGAELENVFQAIKDTPYSRIDEINNYIKILDAIVLKHTNLKTKFYHDRNGSFVSFYQPNINHIFNRYGIKNGIRNKDTETILKDALKGQQQNYVDLKACKVHGIFTELEAEICINFIQFKDTKLTAAHMTAITLHEVGHMFCLYEYMSRQVTTNQVLAGVCKSVINKDSIKTREMVFRDAAIIMNGDESVYKELVYQDDIKVISSVIIKDSLDNKMSELNSPSYDLTAFEQLADQFCTRHGYGRATIESLDLMEGLYGGYEKNRNIKRTLNLIQIFKLSYQGIFAGALIGFAGSSVLLGLGWIFAVCIAHLLGDASNKLAGYFVYDNLKVRYSRIKEDLINLLKDKRTDPKDVKSTLIEIEEIDKIINTTLDSKLVFNILADFIFSKNRTAKAINDLQRNLEQLASNDLFVKAAKLSVI